MRSKNKRSNSTAVCSATKKKRGLSQHSATDDELSEEDNRQKDVEPDEMEEQPPKAPEKKTTNKVLL